MRISGDHRRYARSAILAAVLTAVQAVPGAAREPYTIPNPLPYTYDEIHSVVYDDIPAYLDGAQCGGYANTSVEGRIASVTGVPGRDGEWDGAIATGMAKRLDTFTYPDEATGLSIANSTGSPACMDILRQVQYGIDATGIAGPPGCRDPNECADTCSWANGFQYDVSLVVYECKHIDCQDVCQEVCREEPNPDDPAGSPITVCEQQCSNVCTDVFYKSTDQTYYDSRGASDQFNCSQCIAGDEQLPGEFGREFAGRKYVCTGDADEERSGVLSVPFGWVWGDTNGSAILPTLPQCRQFWVDERLEYPNCTTCGTYTQQPSAQSSAASAAPAPIVRNPDVPFAPISAITVTETPGAECRCGLGMNNSATDGCRITERMSPLNGAWYWSFYRTYPGRYERDEPVGAGSEVLENEGDAFCFGLYEEFDTALRQTTEEDQRCIIDMDVSGMADNQTGYGSYGAPDPATGPDPNDPFWQRGHGPSQQEPFNPLRDLWFLSFGRGFSLLSQPAFTGDLTSALLTIDAAKQTGAWQNTVQPWAEHSFVRAFDDTGEYRSVARWWQQQETLAHRDIIRPSTLRVLLPPPQALGLAADDPLFAGTTPQTAPTDRHAASISLQVDSNGAILDEAVSALERMFRMQIESVRVPIVVPMGSPTEYRVVAESWCLQWMQQTGDDTCDGAPAGVQELRQRLEEYAQRIEDVRKLRAELPFAVGKALELQTGVYAPIVEWMNQNIALYQAYLLQRERIFALLPQWEENVEKMRHFSEDVNMPWCMNRRFTTPVYSLLDPWLPARTDGGSRTMNSASDSLPSLPMLPRQDAMIDISGLRLDGGGVLSIPVFDVTQVKLALLDYTAPEIVTDDDIPPSPPSLPSLDPALAAMRSAATSVASPPVLVLDPPPTISLPPLPTEEMEGAMSAALQNIGDVLDEMTETYEDFWKSIGPLKPDWSDFDQTAQDKLDHRCDTFGDSACQHVEMDLRERYQAIGSRIGILQEEDLDSTGLARSSPVVCPYDDHTCDLLPPTRYPPRTGWQTVGTVDSTIGSAAADTVRAGVRLPTLPQTLGGLTAEQLPPFAVTIDNLVRPLLIPHTVQLTPENTSSLTTQ